MNALKLTLAAAGSAAVAFGMFASNRFSASYAADLPPSSGVRRDVGTDPGMIKEGGVPKAAAGDQLACFSGGCFWGVEDYFRHVPGVVSTAVGYTGGNVPNPSYELVCTHTTGHTESVLVEFNPKKITYRNLVDSFWKVCNPTEVDRQGPDVGSNYRSAIWTFSDAQRTDAVLSIGDRKNQENGPIVTKVLPIKTFYLAEDYHQQYDEKTGRQSCPVRE